MVLRFKQSITLDSRGFTMIELLVVFTVLALLSVIGIASFVDYARSQVLINESNNLITTLNQARSNALNQVKSTTDCPLGESLLGYKVSFVNTSTPNYYNLTVVCSSSTKNILSFNLSQSVTIDVKSNVSSVTYPVLTGEISILDYAQNSQPSGKIVLKLSGAATPTYRQMLIYSSGVITSQACQYASC